MRCFLVVLVLAVSFFLNGGTYGDDMFPIGVNKSSRTFEDATGTPFLLHGDTAWSLIAELSREDALFYLRDRKRRGFNAVLVNLIEHQFSSNPPENIYGDKPFIDKAFGKLNPGYFDHAEWIIKHAEALGISVFLAPSYLGVNGSSQGWFEEAQEAGPDKMLSYGEAIARRFSAYDNIIWVLGGDFDVPDHRLITSLAEGIRKVDRTSMMTVHSGRDTNTVQLWGDHSWLSFDTVYTYGDVFSVVSERTQDATQPVVLLETAYEFEREATAQLIRRNAYGAVLAGAAGQFYGNNPIWHFTGPGVFTANREWKEALDSSGAKSMTILHSFFDRLPWHQLKPDRENKITLRDATFAAALPDMSLIIIYGDADQFNLNIQIGRAKMHALWFDPASGKFTVAKAISFDESSITYTRPDDHVVTTHSDWVLLLGDEQKLRTIPKK